MRNPPGAGVRCDLTQRSGEIIGTLDEGEKGVAKFLRL
jgi:hypothetical protein